MPPYVTLSILVAGVVGGLVIVVAVIVFCKYCVKKDKPLQRYGYYFCHVPFLKKRKEEIIIVLYDCIECMG